MPDTLTCPVCERSGVPANSESCPQCDADLTCFQALETLAEKSSFPAEKSTGPAQGAERENSSGNRRLILLLLLLLLLIGASSLFYILKVKDRVQELKQRVASLTIDLRTARHENRPPEQFLCPLPGMGQAGSAKDAKEEESFAEDDPLIYAEDLEEESASGERREKGSDESAGAAITEQDRAEQAAEGEEQVIARTEQAALAGAAGEEREKEPKKREEDLGEDLKETIPVIRATAVKKKPVHSSSYSEKFADTAPEAEEHPVASSSVSAEEAEEQWAEKIFLYLVKEDDTLWDLAERFYGDGKYYPVILEQNPRLAISRLHDEEVLRLFNDRAVLKEIYSHRIERRNGLMLWKHRVQSGETRQTLKKRFAAPGASGKVLYEKEPAVYPGAIVRVVLH